MRQPNPGKNLRVAMIAGGVALGMVGLSYASVPLYRLFCQVTGFGGTTQRAEAAPAQATENTVSVRFDANTSGSLDWSFHAVQTSMTVKVGEQNMAYYKATNISAKTLTGSAVFNVTPVQAGAYFNKIQCFCFTEQTLQPGQSVEMPVSRSSSTRTCSTMPMPRASRKSPCPIPSIRWTSPRLFRRRPRRPPAASRIEE